MEMIPALCLDCCDEFEGTDRCPACGSARLARHHEIRSLGVAHIDCDAFYASVEKRDNPDLRDKPVIVGGAGGRGVVSTACYIARRYGVRSAMPMAQARKLCPDGVIIPTRMAAYAEVSRAIRAMMLELTPAVEPLSLDEAFLDLRGSERLHRRSPAASMAHLAARIETELGVTASVGLSDCKFLAKLASDMNKPKGFSVIGRAEALEVIAPMSVGRLWGVGAVAERRLKAAGVHTIAQARAMSETQLSAMFGTLGARIYRLSRAEDPRAISADGEAKSISAETTFDTDIGGREALEAQLWRQCERVSARAKAQGLAGGVVVLKLTTPRFKGVTRRRTLDRPTQLADTVFRVAAAMLGPEIAKGPYRLIGVGLGDLHESNGQDGEIGDLFDPNAANRAKAERAMDSVRARFGAGAIIKGRGLT